MIVKKQCLPLTDTENILAILNRVSILAGFTEEQLNHIFGLLEKVSYKAGEKIFEQGEQPSHIYIVESGSVKLTVSRDEANLELIVFDTGCLFGEASVIGIQPHCATATAVEDTELIVLSRTALLSIYESDTKLFSILILNIAREVCRRLHASDKTLLHYVLRK